MAFTDRYREAGLTHNPFAAWQHGDPPITGFVDRGVPDPPPPGHQTLVQVLGESGMGKSTQLGQWRKQTPGPYHYIPRQPYGQRWVTPPKGDPANNIVYGDEIDRMPVPLRRRWFRSLAASRTTVVIGTHVDLTQLGERSGFDVITHQLKPVDRDLLSSLIGQRIDSARCSETSLRFSDADIDLVLKNSQGIPGKADVWCHQILAELVAR